MDLDLQAIAMAKAIRDKTRKEARNNLEAGTHPVDFTTRITGTVTIGEDTEVETKTPPDYKAAFGKAIDLIRKTTGVDEEMIEDIVRTTLKHHDQPASEETETLIEKMDEEFTTRKTSTRKGAVTTKLDVEYVESPSEIVPVAA